MPWKTTLRIMLFVLAGFNLWHATKRGIWDPPSIINSLHLTEEMATHFRPFDNQLKAANFQYDGQYLYAMAYDPLILTGASVPFLNHPAYRYQRMLYPLSAYIFSLGNPKRFPMTLFALNITFLFIGVFFTSKLAKLNGWPSWSPIVYVFNSGLLYSAFSTLTEPLALALSLTGIYLWQLDKKYLASALLAGSVLARETFAIVPLSLVAWDVIWAHQPLRQSVRYMTVAVLPFLVWHGYLRWRLPNETTFYFPPEAPPSFGWGRFSLPFVGLWQETTYALHTLTTRSNIKLTLGISVIVSTGVMVCAVYFKKHQTFWCWLALSQGLFAIILRGDLWNYHASSARVAIPFTCFLMLWCLDSFKTPLAYE